MTLERKIELIHRSSDRMLKALDRPRDRAWWGFMRRESWLHLRRTLELLWAVVRKKVNKDAGTI